MKRGEPVSENKWDELVREIWKENGLKHLRDAATPFQYEESFIYDPSKGTYGFQEDFEITEEDQFVFTDQSDNDELVNQLLQHQPERDEPTHSVPFHPEHPQETIKPCKILVYCSIDTYIICHFYIFLMYSSSY